MDFILEWLCDVPKSSCLLSHLKLGLFLACPGCGWKQPTQLWNCTKSCVQYICVDKIPPIPVWGHTFFTQKNGWVYQILIIAYLHYTAHWLASEHKFAPTRVFMSSDHFLRGIKQGTMCLCPSKLSEIKFNKEKWYIFFNFKERNSFLTRDKWLTERRWYRTLY